MSNKQKIILVLFAILALLFPYDFLESLPFSMHIKLDRYAGFGDFVGGVIGTLVAGVACWLVYKTYMSQKEELDETKKILSIQTNIMEKQRFDSVFFHLLSIHFDKVDKLKMYKSRSRRNVVIEEKEICGTSFFVKVVEIFCCKVNDNRSQADAFKKSFDDIYNGFRDHIDNYFNSLFYLIKIAQDEIDTNNSKSDAIYMDIIKNGLSIKEIEFIYLAYILHYISKDQYRSIIKKCHLFDGYGLEKMFGLQNLYGDDHIIIADERTLNQFEKYEW